MGELVIHTTVNEERTIIDTTITDGRGVVLTAAADRESTETRKWRLIWTTYRPYGIITIDKIAMSWIGAYRWLLNEGFELANIKTTPNNRDEENS